MTLYRPDQASVINMASNALQSGASDLCKDVEADSELLQLICEMIEYLDGELARIQGAVRTVAAEINIRVTALIILMNTYTPEQIESEFRRLRAEMILILADLIEDVICNGVGAMKKVGDAVWESATIERHRLRISTITQIITTPPSVAFGGGASVPRVIEAVEKVRKLSTLASLIRVIAKVIRLIGRLASIVADIQGMITDITVAIDRMDALISGRARPGYLPLSFQDDLNTDLDNRNANIETASSPFPEAGAVVA